MAMSPDDRKTFSLKIVSADSEIANYERAKGQMQAESDKMKKLDDANKNLFDPVNALVNQYQTELTSLDGNSRTTIVEQDIQDAASVKLQNHFYPNDTTVTVPSLAANHNVWTKPKPYARTYAVGKNYGEAFPGTVTKEGDLINAALTIITSALAYSDIERTSGTTLEATGSCSLSQYSTQATCTANGGTWTSGPQTLVTSTAVTTIKSNLVSAINALKTFLTTEVGQIVTTDKDTANQTQNNAAISNINTVIVPALNTWLAYLDFNSTGVNASNYNSYNVSLLGATKLHLTQLTALQTALNTRLAYVATRTAQLNTILGSITQDLETGDVTFTGLYGKRYSFLMLRLDLMNGSLNKLISMKQGFAAQISIVNSIKTNKATYQSIIPTTALAAHGNGTATISVVDASFLAPGDTVYIIAENQPELLRAIKSISGNTVVLNDIVPVKYKTTDKLRLYKDLG